MTIGTQRGDLHVAGELPAARPQPFDYLKDLFTRLPAAKITQIREIKPAAWVNAKGKERVVAQAA